MEQKRETKEIVTNGNHKVVLKTYITGYEKRAIQEAILSEVEIDAVTKSFSGLKGTASFKGDDKAIELLIVSIDGKTENLLQSIMEMPAEDGEDIIREINIIIDGKKKGTNTV